MPGRDVSIFVMSRDVIPCLKDAVFGQRTEAC